MLEEYGEKTKIYVLNVKDRFFNFFLDKDESEL